MCSFISNPMCWSLEQNKNKLDFCPNTYGIYSRCREQMYGAVNGTIKIHPSKYRKDIVREDQIAGAETTCHTPSEVVTEVSRDWLGGINPLPPPPTLNPTLSSKQLSGLLSSENFKAASRGGQEFSMQPDLPTNKAERNDSFFSKRSSRFDSFSPKGNRPGPRKRDSSDRPSAERRD